SPGKMGSGFTTHPWRRERRGQRSPSSNRPKSTRSADGVGQEGSPERTASATEGLWRASRRNETDVSRRTLHRIVMLGQSKPSDVAQALGLAAGCLCDLAQSSKRLVLRFQGDLLPI